MSRSHKYFSHEKNEFMDSSLFEQINENLWNICLFDWKIV
jgi:hypothetical protein